VQHIEFHDRRALRHFALGLAAMVALVFGLAGPWLLDRPWPWWPFLTAVALVLLSRAWPAAVYPLHRLLAPPLGLLARVNTWLLLGLFFYLLLWPFGVFARLTGRLDFVTGFDPAARTYRIRRSANGRRDGPTNLDEPF
jgi:hypothetical protein